jgi:hypothetical protein
MFDERSGLVTYWLEKNGQQQGCIDLARVGMILLLPSPSPSLACVLIFQVVSVVPTAADAKGRDAHRFNINVVGRVYQLKANSEVEANRWLEGLTFAVDRRKVRASTAT